MTSILIRFFVPRVAGARTRGRGTARDWGALLACLGALACSASTGLTSPDGGGCTAAPTSFSSCPVAGAHCTGPTACRSCNVGLWAMRPAWDCVCAEARIDGTRALDWECPVTPVCTAGADTFTDDQCTLRSVEDDGRDATPPR